VAKVWIPADRFVALLDKNQVKPSHLGQAGAKRVNELRRGEQECLSLDAADRILTRVGLAHWFHVPEEQGGLADIYEAEAYEPEWLAAKRAQLERISKRRTFKTPEERREANRLKQARYAAKRKKPCPDCGTPAIGARCHPCHVKSVESPHGSVSRYKGPRKCRCDLCRAAATAYHRDLRRRMKAEYLEEQRRAA